MSRPILLTTDAVGGVWTYSLDLARGLAARGIPVVLAVLGPAPGAAQRREAAAIEGVRLVDTGLPLDWTAADPAALDHASERLAALAALSGVGSAHLHAPALVGRARWSVPVVAVAHSDVGTWWRAMREGPCPADFAWRMEATREGLHRAARVIAPTAAHADAVRAVYGAVEISVVHNGAEPRPASGEPGIAILAAGRLWDEGKGLSVIDQAAATGLAIAAAGPVRGPNGACIDLPHLRLLGELDADGMAAAYARAQVFVSMARYEPFGLSVLEAAQAGLRLVLSDIPSFRELWDGAATFAEPGDLAATLRDALRQSGDGGARAQAGRYTRARMVEGTLAVHAGLGGVG